MTYINMEKTLKIRSCVAIFIHASLSAVHGAQFCVPGSVWVKNAPGGPRGAAETCRKDRGAGTAGVVLVVI